MSRSTNLKALQTPTKRERENPLRNPHLTTAAIEPLGHFILVRIDHKQEKTQGGILLPDGSFGNTYADAGPQAAKNFRYDTTAVVLTLGPDADNVAVGDRFLLPFPPVPCAVTDSDDGQPLGLLDSRDIVCRVKEAV